MSEALTTNNLSSEIVKAFRYREFNAGKESRDEAIRLFEELGLPGSKCEEYRFTPISRSLEKNFSANHFTKIANSSFQGIDEFHIPNYESNLIVFINGKYSPKFSKVISPREQLMIQPLNLALDEKSEWVANHFSKLAEARNDPFTALNTAFWQDGVFIQVPDNTIVEKPIVILHIHDAIQEPVVSLTRLLMLVGENSEARVVEKFDSVGKNPIFSSLVEEISVKAKARLHYCKIQNDHGAFHQVAHTLIHQSDASRVNTFTFSMDGQLIRNNLEIALDGEGCESHFFGLYLLEKNTMADNHTVVDHRKPNSFSNELYKGIMDGNSKGIFNGKIYVRPHAQKTNAFQTNRNILLSDTATINTKPQLEIWADDVKCSHGCTSGQLDEEALFYLQSRGISKVSAQALLLYAFAGEILDPMKDERLRDYLDQLISTRLQKNLAS